MLIASSAPAAQLLSSAANKPKILCLVLLMLLQPLGEARYQKGVVTLDPLNPIRTEQGLRTIQKPLTSEDPPHRHSVHILEGTLELGKQALKLRGDINVTGGQPENGALGGDGQAKVRALWELGHVQDGMLGGGEFRNLYLFGYEFPDDPFLGICILNIKGGSWSFIECEIAGSGSNTECPALIHVGASDHPQVEEELQTVKDSFPLVNLRGCLVQRLESPLAKTEFQQRNVDVLIVVEDRSEVHLEDSELNGGSCYALSLHGQTSTIVQNCLLQNASFSIGLNDQSIVEIRNSLFRDNSYILNLWSKKVSLKLLDNQFLGNFWADLDRPLEANTIEKGNVFAPHINLLERNIGRCEDCNKTIVPALDFFEASNEYAQTGGDWDDSQPASQTEYLPTLTRCCCGF